LGPDLTGATSPLTVTGLIPGDSYYASVTSIGDVTHYTSSVEGADSRQPPLTVQQLATPGRAHAGPDQLELAQRHLQRRRQTPPRRR